MNHYFVIHSTDPYLLARLAVDLILNKRGVFYNRAFLNENPFQKGTKWLVLHGKSIYFLKHKGVFDPTRLTLHSRNYIQVLGKILEDGK